MWSEYGYGVKTEQATSILKELDMRIMQLVEAYVVREWALPSVIDGDVLQRCGYFESMPNQLTKVGIIHRDSLTDISKSVRCIADADIDNTANVYLTPAACLHIYPVLEKIDIHNEVVTTLTKVYRYEDGSFSSGTRQMDFTVREFVAVGTEEFVKEFLASMELKLVSLANEIFNNCCVEVANDHFYPTKLNAAKEKYQRVNNSKKELIVDIEAKKTAISSFNYHSSHFSKEFRFDNEGTIVTGCVGCGMERWISAFLKAHK